MALKRRSLLEDALAIKWSLLALLLSVAAAGAIYISIADYQNAVRNDEFNAYSDLNLVTSQVSEIEEAEQIIVNNIDRFNQMQRNSVLDEEDRVGLLEQIGQIRERHGLFPANVTISEQSSQVLPYTTEIDFPDEQIALRWSRIQVSLPLLHEGDLTRFLASFLSSGRLVVANSCRISEAILEERDLLEVVPHLQSSCEYYWYTLIREPYSNDLLEFE
jgi:hypothetical protein